MRYFNTHGPVNVQEHYVVPRQALVEQLTAQIEQGKFFTIYAPRQIGKTTLLNALEATLRPRPTYLPIVLNFEAYESWAVEQFWEDVALLINEDLEAWAQTVEQPVRSALQTFLAGAPIADEQSFRSFFRGLVKVTPTLKVVLILIAWNIEVDADIVFSRLIGSANVVEIDITGLGDASIDVNLTVPDFVFPARIGVALRLIPGMRHTNIAFT